MSGVAQRLALLRSLAAGRGLSITDVAHSVGSTISVGAGRTTPLRFAKRRQGARRPGYYHSAPFDLFLMSANWEIAGKTGYRLRWKDEAQRIAKESAKLIGLKIQAVDMPRFSNRIKLAFRGGVSLTVWPDDTGPDFGWTLRVRRRFLSLGDSE